MTKQAALTNYVGVKNDILSSKIDRTVNSFSVSKAQSFCAFSRKVPVDVGKTIGENLLW